MAITIAQFPALLLPGVNKVFGDYDKIPTQWSEIFEKNTSEMNYERDVEMKMLGLAQLRTEGAATAFEDMGQRYTYFYRHVGIALGFVMTKFAIRDNLYKSEFGPNTNALKFSMAQTKEVIAAAVLNNAADTTGAYNGGDGQPLLSTAHPIENGTVANTLAVPAELNETSLQDMIVLQRRFRDAAGLRVLVKPTKLVVAPEGAWAAERLLRSSGRVGTNDNDVNAIKSMGILPGGYVINDFITNPRAWYLLSNVPNGLKYFSRDPLEVDMKVDFTTDNVMTKATERYSFGWSNFRAIAGSMP